MPRVTGNLATSLVLNHQMNTRTRFGSSGLAAKRTGIRSLSVMAIRRGVVIDTCPFPCRAYLVCSGVGQSGLRQAFDALNEPVAVVAVLAG